jgi:hypothetical protein
MSDHFEIPVGEPQDSVSCDFCEEPFAYWADNNSDRAVHRYCVECEERRSDKYGCAMLVAEGVMCQDGACGCDGSGVL